METKKILSWIALLCGEAILIAAFFIGSDEEGHDAIFKLNLVISSLVYASIFADILIPWVNFGDKAQRTVGSLGIRWIITSLYAIAAIGVMLVCNIAIETSFAVQFIIHLVLLFMLFMGMIAMLHSTEKTAEVYAQEVQNTSCINKMKQITMRIDMAMAQREDIPAIYRERINEMKEDINYLVPCNTSESKEAEREIVQCLEHLLAAIDNYTQQNDYVDLYIKKTQTIFNIRKNIYSN